MKTLSCVWLLSALLIVGTLAPPGADAQDDGARADASRPLRVMTSGGFAAAYAVLGPRFEQATGVALETTRGASSGGAPTSIPSRLARGEPADAVILSRSALDRLADGGDVRPDTRVDLARSTIGVAIRAGAPVPDIGSQETFVAAVLAAESIGYSASASGTYLSTELFPRLGIWEQVRSKGRRIVGEPVAHAVARGEVEMGFQQVSEILPVEGVYLVGPLPAGLQKVTTFSAGITQRAANAEDARRLIEFLSSAAVAGTIAETGLVPIVREDRPPGTH